MKFVYWRLRTANLSFISDSVSKAQASSPVLPSWRVERSSLSTLTSPESKDASMGVSMGTAHMVSLSKKNSWQSQPVGSKFPERILSTPVCNMSNQSRISIFFLKSLYYIRQRQSKQEGEKTTRRKQNLYRKGQLQKDYYWYS